MSDLTDAPVLAATRPSTVAEVLASSPRPGWRRWSSPHVLLMVVAVAYCIAGFLRIPHGMSPTWDEVVYLSQVARGVEPVGFSQTRAWGMTLIVAPVAVITPSIVVIRSYLTLMSGLALYLAFRPWLGLARDEREWTSYVAPAAAAGFSTLWTTLLFGSMAYPNVWLSFAIAAGVGHLCRLLAAPHSNGALFGVAVSFAAASLLRPTDALAAGAGPLAVMVLWRSMRRIAPAVAVLGGLGLGWVVWIAEAYARFGGPLERLRRGSEIIGSEIGFTLRRHLDVVDGPYIACIPERLCAGGPWVAAVWWFALPIVALLGIAVARRSGRAAFYVLPGISCVTFTAQYVVMSPENSQARFLLPAYSLLMVPTAYFLVWATSRMRSVARLALVVGTCTALALHIVIQQATLDRVLDYNLPGMQRIADRAQGLREAAGVQRPCLLYGAGAVQLSYLTGCAARHAIAAPRSDDPAIESALAEGDTVVILVRDADTLLPAPYSGWERVEVRSDGTTLYAYISPSRDL